MATIVSGRVLTPSYRQATLCLPWCGLTMLGVGQIRTQSISKAVDLIPLQTNMHPHPSSVPQSPVILASS